MNALEVCGILFLAELGIVITVTIIATIVHNIQYNREVAKRIVFDALEKDIKVNGKSLSAQEKLEMMSKKDSKFEQFAKEVFGKKASEQDIVNFVNHVSNMKKAEKELKEKAKNYKLDKRG